MSAAALLLAVLLLCPCLGAQDGLEQAPSFSPDSIVNSASGSPLSLAPNVLATVYGSNLAYSTVTAAVGLTALDLPSDLGKVRIFIAGISAPLLYVSPTQVNFLIPGFLQPGKLTFALLRQTTATQVQIILSDVAPALFLVDGGRLAATHADGKLITAEAPAAPGEIVVVYGEGLGVTDPRQLDGAIPRAAARLVSQGFRVVLGEQLLPATSVLYAGVAPGFPGLYQINFRLPGTILTKQLELRVGFDGQMSQSGLPLQVTPSEP